MRDECATQCESNAPAMPGNATLQDTTLEDKVSTPHKPPKGGDVDPEFSAWYERYPHKVGKAAAVKAFRKAKQSASLADLIAGVNRYIAAKPPDRAWCNPATWLNEERWKDQPAQAPSERRGSVIFG